MKSAIVILLTGVLLYEIFEHVVFPLIWFIKDRKRKSVCGATGLLGKKGEIRCWNGSEGQVFVHGELWRAASDVPLTKGDKVVLQNINGLTVKVIPLGKTSLSGFPQDRPPETRPIPQNPDG